MSTDDQRARWREAKRRAKERRATGEAPGASRWRPDGLAPHGTAAAARRHRRAGEPLCIACRAAERDQTAQRRAT